MLTVFSDLHCPWAYVFSIRLRRARAAGPGQGRLVSVAFEGSSREHAVGPPQPVWIP